MYIYLYNLVI